MIVEVNEKIKVWRKYQYKVEANNKEEAIKKIENGEYKEVEMINEFYDTMSITERDWDSAKFKE